MGKLLDNLRILFSPSISFIVLYTHTHTHTQIMASLKKQLTYTHTKATSYQGIDWDWLRTEKSSSIRG